MRSRGRYTSFSPECVVLAAVVNFSYANPKPRSLLKAPIELSPKSLCLPREKVLIFYFTWGSTIFIIRNHCLKKIIFISTDNY